MPVDEVHTKDVKKTVGLFVAFLPGTCTTGIVRRGDARVQDCESLPRPFPHIHYPATWTYAIAHHASMFMQNAQIVCVFYDVAVECRLEL